MSTYNHQQNINELEEKAMIYTGYDYSNNDRYGLAESFFQFCQQNLSEENNEFQIQPARLLILNDPSINALATKRYSYYVVGINIGTLTKLHWLFTERSAFFDNGNFDDFLKLESQLDVSLDILMYQIATQFTYYHELAHLIQYSPLDKEKSDKIEESTYEAYSADTNANSPYDLVKHLKEFDADLYGAYFISLHLLEYWNKLDISDRTQDNLEQLLSIGVSGVFTYFLLLMENQPGIYYDSASHPHPLIRILYIIDMFIKTIQENNKENFELKIESVLKRAFRITEEIFTFEEGENLVKKYADIFWQEKEKIELHVNNVLIPESRKYPFLTLERNSKK